MPVALRRTKSRLQLVHALIVVLVLWSRKVSESFEPLIQASTLTLIGLHRLIDDFQSPSAKLQNYQNVRGLRMKIDDLFLTAVDSNYDVIVLTETWLDERINSTHMFGSVYTVFRNDRNHQNSSKSRGGGVLIAISNHFSCCRDPTPNDLALVLGDYNQSGLTWNVTENDHPINNVLHSNIPASYCTLLDGFSLHNLTQINKILNINSRILDFVLVNEAAIPECSVIEASEPLIGIDNHHPALEIPINLSLPVRFDNTADVRELDFRTTDSVALRQLFARTDCQFLDSHFTIDEAVNCFEKIVSRAISDCVPLSRTAPKPAWSNARLRHLKRLRFKALRKYSRTRNSITKRLLSVASKEYRSYNRFLYNRYTRRLQDNLRHNPKQFWSFVETKRKEDGLPVEIHLGNKTACTSLEKCKLLCEHFKSVFNYYSASSTQVDHAVRDTPRDVFDFDIITISPAIKKLKFSNAAGPDEIPSNMEAGVQVDVVYTDLKAAFDRIDYTILLAKLEKLGVSPRLARWFKLRPTN
ncbi:uncharacterized protein LOC129767048 [Toxorhynchites rutilus septentrionalis]|uniref:uncharacterized protein LOC129767048 n=1 Tax=Toxorhynchites rutilus septentrionalis TaxID=329112 RepID=UPI0024794FAE|nr:uncharacterized protein LOC129767048 [Toxorhynchites rutilus septentrionalis]